MCPPSEEGGRIENIYVCPIYLHTCIYTYLCTPLIIEAQHADNCMRVKILDGGKNETFYALLTRHGIVKSQRQAECTA